MNPHPFNHHQCLRYAMLCYMPGLYLAVSLLRKGDVDVDRGINHTIEHSCQS